MDEQVIQDLFNRAISQGYSKTLEEFKVLLNTDDEVIQDNFQYVTSQGYNKSLDDFKVLIGSEKKKDIAQAEEFLQKTSSEEPSVATPPTYEVDEQGEIIIPEVLEEEVKKEKPSDLLSTEEKKKILQDNALDVDVFLQQARAGEDIQRFSKSPIKSEFKNAAQVIDMSTTDEDAVDILYNTYITNRVFAPQNIALGEDKLVKKEREAVQVDPEYQTEVDRNILNELNINIEDYNKWEKETQREETKTFKFIKGLLSNKEGDQLEKEKKDFEKVSFYKTDVIESLGKDIEQVNAKILSGNFNEEDIKKLQDIKSQLGNKYIEEVSSLKKLDKMFPLMAKYSSERDLKRRKKIYEAGEKGGINYLAMEAGESLKRIPEVVTDFAMNTVALIPSLFDQAFVAGPGDFDKKGLFAGITEAALDASERAKEFLDVGQRQGAAQGKTVFYQGKEYFVTYSKGKPESVLDAKTGVRMDGIISDENIKNISDKSASIPNVEDKYFGGAFVSNTVQTISNLMALIRTGKQFQKKLGVSGNVGMGLSSYASRAASEVEDMRADLVAAGIPEDEAYGKAIMAGNAIASLDGIFSGLAGSNEKLLAPLTAIRQQIINVVKQDGKTFTKKQLGSKFKDIFNENLKEVTVEELPVLFSEKGVNRAVNWATDTVVRNDDITSAEIGEVVAMTVVATSGVGSKNLLTNNQRQDAVRFLARTTKDLDGLVNKLVSDGDITLEEGKNLRGEVYEMQVAELQTKGTIVNSDNMVQASDLLQQRNKLVEKKKDLEGPLKEDIDKEIENVDEQIREVVEKDKQQTQEILKEEEVEEEVVTPQFTDKEVIDRIKRVKGSDVYTQQEFDNMKNVMIREAEQEAIEQAPLVAEQEQVREEIVFPYKPKKAKVDVNIVDGKVQSINKKNTKQPATKSQKSIAEKDVLTNVIDVNAGKKVEIPADATPQDIPGLIFTDSENVREIAEAIDTEKKRLKESKTKGRDVSGGIYDILNLKFTPESWRNVTGLSSADSKVQFWISNNGVSIEDGWQEQIGAEAAAQLSTDQIVDFIETYNTAAKVAEFKQGDPEIASTIRDLETKFKDLTGISPTPTNIKTVINIDPNRPPLKLIEEQVAEQEAMQIAEGEIETFGKKKAPAAKRLLGIKKKMVTVDEAAALKESLRKEAKAAREAKADVKKKRNDLIDKVREIEGRGVISTKQTKAIINVLGKVNIDNPAAVNKALDYAEKVIQNADNIQKLKDAESIRSRIKKAYKRKNVEATLSNAAEQFIEINPRQVTDIDSYLEKATEVLKGISPSRIVKDGVKIAPTFDIKKINEYSTDAIEKQDIKNKEANEEIFADITGLDPSDFTLEEMQKILYDIELTQEAKDKRIQTKEKIIRDGIKKANETYSAIVDSILEKGIDPFTGEKIELSSDEKQLVKDFINIDVNKLSTKDALGYIDSLINFATNQTTGRMQVFVSRNEGNIDSEKFEKTGEKAKPISAAEKAWYDIFATVPNLYDRIFKSQRIGGMFMKMSGLTDYINGSAKAKSKTDKLVDRYQNKYEKQNPNGKSFNDAENITERGLGAFMSRSVVGDPKIEFDRRKKLIEESITKLNKGTKLEKVKAEEYQLAYDKLLKDSNTVEDVQSKMNETNLEAINWWMNEWSNIYNDLSEVSLNVYNSVLGKDVNYTPDSFIRTEGSKEPDATELGKPTFENVRTRIYDEKSGTLIEPTKPTDLPKNRVINLNFDSQNASSYKNALTDINTASSVQKLIGFTNSDAFKNVGSDNIFPDESTRDMAYQRIQDVVEAKRGITSAQTTQQAKTIRQLNRLSGIGTSRILGGPTQFVKQLIPMVNTLSNAGGMNSVQAIGLMGNPDVRKLIDESGRPIANRGVESQTTTSFNSALDAKAKTKGGKLVDNLANLNKLYLKNFLVAPDKLAARQGFIAYYLQDLKKQGVDVSGIDWSTHKLNDRAADYAQQQVDRQQNVSDIDLQGRIYRSNNPYLDLTRKILLPFANFVMNQKIRMYNDVTTILSKSASKQDKLKAARSVAVGLPAETILFNATGYAITTLLGGLARSIKGYEEDDEESKERFDKALKGKATAITKDILSPAPVFDTAVAEGINRLLSMTGSEKRLYGRYQETLFDDLGTLGIAGKNALEVLNRIESAVSGKSVTEYKGKTTIKELNDEQRDNQAANALLTLLYSLGYLPSEAGYVLNQIEKYNLKTAKEEKKRTRGGRSKGRASSRKR
jgi:hypothetical protein